MRRFKSSGLAPPGVRVIIIECQRRSTAPADITLFAALLAAVADRCQPLVVRATAGIAKTPLTPDRNTAEVVVMAALGRLPESSHDGAPVLAVPRTRPAVDKDGDGVADFMGDGLVVACGVDLRDGQIEADDLRSQAPAMPAELDLAGAATGQIEVKGRPLNAVQCPWIKPTGLMPVFIGQLDECRAQCVSVQGVIRSFWHGLSGIPQRRVPRSESGHPRPGRGRSCPRLPSYRGNRPPSARRSARPAPAGSIR